VPYVPIEQSSTVDAGSLCTERPPGNPENGRTYKVLRQCFKAALKEANLEADSFGRPHTLTSVRHTAFMLVLERNEGRNDLQTLAQNVHKC